jgi:D-beta-D-heptose 7-phosphate kinase/D-beta-D-heptose 1-phosphate adenosyltransferase
MEHVIDITRKPNIIVVGDIILDHTFNGSVARIANEAPIPIYKHTRESWSLGGAGNVVANLAAMGCENLYLFGRTGESSQMEELLAKCGAHNELLYDPSLPTIIKTRYYCDKTLLFRHDQETVLPINTAQEDAVIERIRVLLAAASAASAAESVIDCIVFSDYNKGFLTHRLCQSIIQLARAHGIFTCVDPKADPAKYAGCSLIKPNRTETLKLFGVQVNGINTQHAHEVIHSVIGCTDSVITLSEQGMSLFQSAQSQSQAMEAIHCANQPMDVIDVTGAGDVVCATLAYLYPIYPDKHEIMKLANILAMISVGHLGSYVVRLQDFIRCRAIMNKYKQISPVQLRSILDILHAEKQTSVFTNGCFDIIHVGHLDLLKQCKEMGNIVIVGLNSDASISRLKGHGRPINKIEKRIAFLSALEYVNYIVVFEEDTPAELLAQLRPSILVKGGDYSPEQIIGREYVNEVRIIPFVEGYSSTSVIRTILCSRV